MHRPAPSIIAAVLVATLGIALFAVMDAAMKGLSLAIGAYNAMLWRQVATTALSGPTYLLSGTAWPSARTVRLSALRGAIGAVMAFCFFWGLTHIPLAEGTALSFIAPLIALYLAAVILKEQIGPGAIIASILGLAGVAIILSARIGDKAMDDDALWGSISILVSAILYAYNLILQRQLALEATPIQSAALLNFFAVITLAPLAPFLAVVPEVEQWPMIAFSAALTFVSLLLLAWAYARAEAKILVNVEYSAFIWAAILGWVYFDEKVSWAAAAGAMLIVAGCIIAARQKSGDAPAATPASVQ